MLRPPVTGYQGIFLPGKDVLIAQGDQLSEAFNCAGFVLTGIIMPNVFTGTALTFQVGDSIDGYQADGQIVFGSNPADQDTLTLNGVVITFFTSPSTGDVEIAGTAALTMAALQAFLDATVDEDLLALTYSSSGTAMIVKAVAHGTDGNAIVFDKSSSHMTLTPSGGTLSGGGFRDLYNASGAVSLTVAQGRSYAIDPANFQGVPFMKIKSGSAELAPRTIVCTLKGF